MTNYEKILDFALNNNLNVLLIGKHGVGKTMIIKQTFERYNLKWKYFSASTMDPWVDFIGVPKEKTDANGNCYLDLVRPKDFAYDEVEALFFDELNRSHKKIRNSVMELIQFKSINGKKFNNLKVVWAAINPDDDEQLAYDVEKMDQAQKDRFQIHIAVDYKPEISYFRKKYPKNGELAVKWWHTLTEPQQLLVSPRRLDYALEVSDHGGDIRNVLNNKQLNISELVSYLTLGDPKEDLEKLLTSSDEEIKKFFSDHNNLKRVYQPLLSTAKYLQKLVSFLPDEEVLKLIKKKSRVVTQEVVNNPGKFLHIAKTIINAGSIYPVKLRRVLASALANITKNQTALPSSVDADLIELDGKTYSRTLLRVILTGTFQNRTRLQICNYFNKMGIRIGYNLVKPNATKQVILVAGLKPTQRKLTLAKKLGVPIVSEQDFINALLPKQSPVSNNTPITVDSTVPETVEVKVETQTDWVTSLMDKLDKLDKLSKGQV